MKKLLCFFVIMVITFLIVVGCGKTKTLHCDYCKKEVFVGESSNMEEDWIIYCKECNEELFSDHPILGNG